MVALRILVAPHAGAWIETSIASEGNVWSEVAPHAGAWIETFYGRIGIAFDNVAPHAGAWIETTGTITACNPATSRAPCGRVD